MVSHGVTFALEGSGAPVLAEVGCPIVAFGTKGGAECDTPIAADAPLVGDYFPADNGK